MKATITVECDNAAFDPAPEFELARILRVLAQKLLVAAPEETIACVDFNGNRVGQLEWSNDGDPA